MDTVGNPGLLQMLDGFSERGARVVTALGYCDDAGVQVVVGEVKGHVSLDVRGDNGFGYDPIFVPIGFEKTFAEMSDDEKDRTSMRAIAAAELQRHLKARG